MSQQSSAKAPPYDLRAEAAVLGAVLLDNDSLNRIVSTVHADQFYREAHREIYRAIVLLAERDLPIDTVTLSEQLRAEDRLQQAGGGAYLVQLSNETPAAVNIEHYAKIVREKAIVRLVIDAARDMVQDGLGDPGDVIEFVEKSQQRIFEIASDSIKTSIPSIREVIGEAFKHIETLLTRKERITGVPTGFVDLDQKLSGLQPSELYILASRPAMGKTALGLNIAANAALKGSVPTVVFSLEMSSQQLAMRMLCTHARVNHSDLRTGRVSDHDWSKIIKAVGALSEARLYIDDTPALSVLDLRARCRRLQRERGLGLVVIDYLQLMRSSDRAARRGREQEISEISRSLKMIAKELNAPVVALAQLNRGVESRADKRPMMSDLRESGAIEQDADVIMFLYRDEYYNPDTTEKPGVAELIIGKQRSGPTGTVELKFTGKYTRFDNLMREDDAAPPPPGPF